MKNILIKIVLLLGLINLANADEMVDDPFVTKVSFDKFEVNANKDRALNWESTIWLGYDLNKLYIYNSGEYTKDSGLESSSSELVYSKAISPFWDFQIGLAYDKVGSYHQTWGVLALSGLAPYYFETRVALKINKDGNVAFDLSSEYELMFTQKLILTPSIEATFYTKNDKKLQIGSGLSRVEAGLRLRYEVTKQFAPYIGFSWEKSFGNTKKYNPIDKKVVVAGIKWWF